MSSLDFETKNRIEYMTPKTFEIIKENNLKIKSHLFDFNEKYEWKKKDLKRFNKITKFKWYTFDFTNREDIDNFIYGNCYFDNRRHFPFGQIDILPLLTFLDLTKKDLLRHILQNKGPEGMGFLHYSKENISKHFEEKLEKLMNLKFIDYFDGIPFKISIRDNSIFIDYHRHNISDYIKKLISE